MEALEFLKEAQRLCKEYSCSSCPVGEKCVLSILEDATIDGIHDSILAIEQWSKKHPIVTNARKFKEIFGLPAHCMIDQNAQWWDEPYKEPEHD